ncbi:glutaminase A [Cellulomonas sp. PhB150]|uniref:glutaminase A n=1 Tax=Cellulomonas sp. PhB150 TaxID=2485188 RepID=UPI000FB108BE|nr:glutaminase A [Cellulomonas sp. PhB150]ROS23780.1 L-glutaminase [Cellulomonas sp. PhB150]
MTDLTAVSTGRLPDRDRVRRIVDDAHARFAGVDEGRVADYIPALASADPGLFGLSMVAVDGASHDVGDTDHPFSIQSISKAFVYALVCQDLGHDEVLRRIGVDGTGLPFDSVMALELNRGAPMNPMVNAGALATTSLVAGGWEAVVDGLSAFAGRRLEVDEGVYASEAATNRRNQAIARLLQSYGTIYADPLETTDVYTRQCSLLVTTHDLGVMAATLADGGVNPITHERVVDAAVCLDVLAALATAGLYEQSGQWLATIGLPGKSGVSGGIITIAPGKGGLATFSPPLDVAGNSVRGRLATHHLSQALGLNIFASAPHPDHG